MAMRRYLLFFNKIQNFVRGWSVCPPPTLYGTVSGSYEGPYYHTLIYTNGFLCELMHMREYNIWEHKPKYRKVDDTLHNGDAKGFIYPSHLLSTFLF